MAAVWTPDRWCVVGTEWAYYDVEDTWSVCDETETDAVPFWCVQWKAGREY
jgi:hypothetical protein